MVDPLISHSIYVNRYGASVYKDLIPHLKELRDRLTTKILLATDFQKQRLTTMIQEINLIIDDGLKPLNPNLFDEFIEYEAEFNTNLLNKYTNSSAVISEGLNVVAMSEFIKTKSKLTLGNDKPQTINQLINTFSKAYKQDIKREIEFGIAEGETTQEIAKRIQTLSNGRTRQQAEAVVRTLTNHVSNQVRSKVYEENKDIIKYEIYTSILDSRTTPICQSLSGKRFEVGKGPVPPVHYSCRSVRIVELKSEFLKDIEFTQSSEGGYVPAEWNYNQWLKNQSVAKQNEILGTARAKAYRKSGKPIDKFVDSRGKYYTLEQLKEKDLIE